LLVSGVTDLEALAFGGQLGGEGGGTGRAGVIAPGMGIGDCCSASAWACAVSRSWLLTSGGAAARARCPWRARASRFALVKAAEDVGFVADLKRTRYCLTHAFEFRVASMRQG